MDVSAVILTYNEQTRLRDCLASAAWCDEVVVVDGYSTDDTVAVAREFTDKVFLSDRLGPSKPEGSLSSAILGWNRRLPTGSSFSTQMSDLRRNSARRFEGAFKRASARTLRSFASVGASIPLEFILPTPTEKHGRRECFVGDASQMGRTSL